LVDIHSHILSGLDDGSKSLEMSVEMVRLAGQTGTTDIVATPHANSLYPFEAAVVQEKVRQLRRLAGEGVRIHWGCDFHLSHDNIRRALEDPGRYTVNGLGYLMVEFPELPIFHFSERILTDLQKAGMVPVVTHPERNEYLAKDVKRLRRWVESGVFLQITAQSLLGQFGPEAAECGRALVEKGLVHFVASDGHDLVERPPRLDLARQYLIACHGEELADLLVEEHPRAVVEGRPLTPGPMVRRRPEKRWYRRWR
jgi:protein-tyrosine phosphatase